MALRHFGQSPAMAWIMLALAPLFWGGNIVLGRYVHEALPPVQFSFARWSLTIVLLLPFAWKGCLARRAILLRHWKIMLALALTGCAGFHTTLYLALNNTMALNVALMMANVPLAIVLLDRLLFGRPVRIWQTAGIFLSMAGVFVILTRGDFDQLASLEFSRGDLWMMVAVPCWALYTLLLRRAPVEIPPLTQLSVTGTLAVGLLLPFALCEAGAVTALAENAGYSLPGDLFRGEIMPLSWLAVLAVGYVSIGATIAAFLLYIEGVKRVGPARAGPFNYLVPVYATILAILLLAEPFYSFHMWGSAAILAGLVLASKAPGGADSPK